MDILPSDKHTAERRIAETIANKLKKTAATLESNDPAHKNGVKYMISRKVYENIIQVEFETRELPHRNRMIVREFINRKLKPV
jgi:hypothetical protein